MDALNQRENVSSTGYILGEQSPYRFLGKLGLCTMHGCP